MLSQKSNAIEFRSVSVGTNAAQADEPVSPSPYRIQSRLDLLVLLQMGARLLICLILMFFLIINRVRVGELACRGVAADVFKREYAFLAEDYVAYG